MKHGLGENYCTLFRAFVKYVEECRPLQVLHMHFLIWRHCRLAPCTSNHPGNLLLAAVFTFARRRPPSCKTRSFFRCSLFPFFLGRPCTRPTGSSAKAMTTDPVRQRHNDEKTFLLPLFLSFLPCSVFLLGQH